jgi:hypothetical protein
MNANRRWLSLAALGALGIAAFSASSCNSRSAAPMANATTDASTYLKSL